MSVKIKDSKKGNKKRYLQHKEAHMCSIFGVIALKPTDPEDVLTYIELLGTDNQHRGHEWFGMTWSDGKTMRVEKRRGWVTSIFGDRTLMRSIHGHQPQMALCHTRFATQGASTSVNAQPPYLHSRRGIIALASNGDIVDYGRECSALKAKRSRIIGDCDAELLLHHILEVANDDTDCLPSGIRHLMENVAASYSAWIATEDIVRLFRDPWANRPLFYMMAGSYIFFSSEDCALYGILSHRAEQGKRDGTVEICQVLPGEMITIKLHGSVTHEQLCQPKKVRAPCRFESVYLRRPDTSIVDRLLPNNRVCYKIVVRWEDGEYYFEYLDDEKIEEVFGFRYRLGQQLAQEHPAPEAEYVIGVPESGNPAAVGFADGSGLSYRIGFVRNPYVMRTFISPGKSNRQTMTAIKFRPLRSLILKLNRVVLVDDSVVFGTSMEKLIRMLHTAGCKKVDLRVSCPPVKHPCRTGIDMSSKGPLIAAVKRNVEEIGKYFRVASIGYLSVEGLKEVLGPQAEQSCLACWTGKFPI